MRQARKYYKKALDIDPLDRSIIDALAALDGPPPPPPPPPAENHPPQIASSMPEERTVIIPQGESRAFLANAKDPDNDAITYSWEVDGRPVTGQDRRFSFLAQDVGSHRIRVAAIDPNGLSAEAKWDVQVQPIAVEPQLVMYTPHQRRLSLFPHQIRFFGVQVEVPGVAEPNLQYAWTLNGEAVPGKELYELRDPPVRTNEIRVRVSTPAGKQLSHQWTVEVRGPKKAGEVPDIWWPRTQVLGTGDLQTVDDKQAIITRKGKVINIDPSRAADNVIVEVKILGSNGQTLARHIAIPSPPPNPPMATATSVPGAKNRPIIGSVVGRKKARNAP